MKLNRILEYLRTLAQVRGNFFREVADTATNEIDKAYATGMVDAHREQQRDIEQINSATLMADLEGEKPTPAPTHETAPQGVTLQ